MVDSLREAPALVAVASKTGERIDECFGRAAAYRIYETLPEGGYRLREVRPGPAPCRDQWHDPAVLVEAAKLLSDCDLALAGRIGPEAIRQLAALGVTGLAVNNLEIGEALARLTRKAAAVKART